MAVLNLRDVPDELARELRVEAAQEEMGVREYCVTILASRKKIADVSVGGEASEGVGTPDLSRSGKAQDGDNIPEIRLKARSMGITTMALPDGVPCSHAGCLSHLSHPCEGCGRIGGVRSEKITRRVFRPFWFSMTAGRQN